MKKNLFLVVLLASVSLPALAATPKTWSSYVDFWLNYTPVASDPAFTEISAFTPDSAITVTRIEIDAHVGPLNNSTTPLSACVTNPSLTLTGGTKTFTLTLATPPNLSNPSFHSYTDSGALRLNFPAHTRLSLRAIVGDSNCAGGSEVNIVVQYRGQDEY